MKDVHPCQRMTQRNGFLDHELGKGWAAPFTGFSWKAFEAYLHLVNAWYAADGVNQGHIESALRRILPALQPSELPAAKMAIYGLGNQTAMETLWYRIKPTEPAAAAAELAPRKTFDPAD